MLTWLVSVPVRSLTVMVSVPSRASTLIVSMLFRSIATIPISRVRLTWLQSPDIGGQREVAAMRRDVDGLGNAGILELQRVEASLAVNGVAAIARVPDEHVVTRAKQCRLAPAAAVDDIIAGAADDLVIAVAAVEREVDLTGVELRCIDRVVTGAAVDDQRVVERLGAVDGDLRREALDHDRCAAGGDADLVIVGRAVGNHGVGRAVARSALC